MTAGSRRRFSIDHLSSFEYDRPVRGAVMLLRLRPVEDRDQQLMRFGIEVDPVAATIPLNDAFGNACHLFNIHRDHTETRVHSRSTVETADPPELPGRLDADAWGALRETALGIRHWEFLTPSRFTCPSPILRTFAEECGLRRGPDPLTTLRETCSALHRAFTYAPGTTDVDSPPERILETRQGVCQDYTHVMLALARGWGIPGRYVSGYLHLEGRSGEQVPQGASHAWAEFLLPGLGWVGFDPTNDTPADHRHVRLARGRDYIDAAPTRGVVFGGGNSSLEVSVSITETGGDPSPKMPRREPSGLRSIMSEPRVAQEASQQ